MIDAPTAPAYRLNGRLVAAEDFYAVACDPRRSVAVEACAGAGKTWMLVSRIVRALLEGLDPLHGQGAVAPHEILAITFTKRAATEMRERLYLWLREFAGADEERCIAELRLRGVHGAGGDADLRGLARRLALLYPRVLETGRMVQIRTFHSWFAALLRAAPLAVLHRLQLPLAYELLEDDADAKRQVWLRFYQALVDDAALHADFLALVQLHGRSQTEKALALALDKRIEFLLADAAGVALSSVQPFAALFPALAAADEPMASLRDAAARARWLERAERLGRETAKTPQNAARAVLDALARIDAAGNTAEQVLAVLRKGFFVAEEDRLTHHLRKFDAAREAAQELQLLCAAMRQHTAWCYQQRMVRLSRRLIAEYAALKRDRGWVNMTDVERSALTLLADPVLSGWVQERLDARVRHLLIDEFQDTNPLQWQALSSWLGSYAGARGSAPSVFIVGDPKQSIYRFRRAEPQVFKAAQEFVVAALGGDLLSCDHTRRNARQVIAAVNATMAQAAETDGFDGFRLHTTSSAETGLVASLPPIARTTAVLQPAAADPQGWRDSLTTAREEAEETLRTREARQAARWVAGHIAAGLGAHEVMVLSRRRAGLLPMQLELRALQIPAQIGEKTALIDCCEVQDLVALLDVLVSRQHDLSLARVLKSPLFGLDDDALVALAQSGCSRGAPWFDRLQQAWPAGHPLAPVGNVLHRWRAWVQALPPHDALQAIYDDGDVLACFAAAAPPAQRAAVLANLRSLLEATLQIGGGRYATAYAFVRALKAGNVAANAQASDGAVRLLTIHGAKGLEARAVLLLDTDTPERAPDTMGVLVNWPGHAASPARFVFLASERSPPECASALLELERSQRRREELNALYVALTRARDTLVISAIEPYREAPRSWWQRLSAQVGEQIEPTLAPPPLPVGGARAGEFSLLELPPAPPAQAEMTAGADVPQQGDGGPSARIGQAMHRLLEWGDWSTHDLAAVAQEFLLAPDLAADAAAMARRIRHGAGAWTWDPAVVDWRAAEVDLVHAGVSLRLDRLVRQRDTAHWWVLDFKSALHPLGQPELLAQLQTYRAAVQAIDPQATVFAAFLTADGSMVALPDNPNGAR